MVLAQRRQQIDHARVPDLPQPSDYLGLRVWGDFRQQLGNDIPRVGLLEQAGPEVDKQPGAVGWAQLGILAVLMQPDCGVRAQQRLR